MPRLSRSHAAQMILFAALALGAVAHGPASSFSAAPNAVLTPPPCKGSLLVLTPAIAPDGFYADPFPVQRGVYISALKSINVCSIGVKLQVSNLPQTLNAYIYNANGSTRGSLLASGSVQMSGNTNSVHYVPISATLAPCKDYELVLAVPTEAAWDSYSMGLFPSPFDVGGSIRVREGSANGDASNGFLLHFEVIGSATTTQRVSDFAGPGAAPNLDVTGNQERGVYVHMLDTAQLGSFGFEANLVAGTTLTARVYAATGTTRGAQLASGTYIVPSSGLQWHDVPVDFQLKEGSDYDIAIAFGAATSWPWWNEAAFTEPFAVGVFQIVSAEGNGDASTTKLPHVRAKWDEKVGGTPFDLSKLTGTIPPTGVSTISNDEYGVYITSLANERLYGIGWMADIPAGQTITAYLYEASGVTRTFVEPAVTATIVSSGSGTRWHDIPLSYELKAGTDYDIGFDFGTVNQWRFYGEAGLPYTSYGVIQVRDGEHRQRSHPIARAPVQLRADAGQ